MWYVLSVKTGQEMNVFTFLEKNGFPACVPRENRLVRKEGAWEKKEYTLFPGYVFVNVTYRAETYYFIRDIPGVQRFLGPDGLHPSPLSRLEAEWIRLLSCGGIPLEPTLAAAEENGEIRMTEGILLNFITRIQKLDKHARRAKVELTVCGETKILPLSFQILNDTELNQDPATVTEG